MHSIRKDIFLLLGLIAVAALLVLGQSMFGSKGFASVELGVSEHSPMGFTGGVVIPASCPSYDHTTTGTCSSCPTGYTWDATTDQCTVFVGCPSGYVLSGGVCVVQSSGCTSNDCGSGDVCKNLPGTQASVPTGYSSNTVFSGYCLPTSCPKRIPPGTQYTTGSSCDYCLNTSGTQNSGASTYATPSGYTISTAGSCQAIPVAETCSITPSATTIASGGSSTLTWTCSQSASSAGLNFSTGGAPSGSVAVSPTVTTSYSLSCSAGCGATATVTVTNPSLSISANPTRVHSGETSTISWSASQVTSCTVAGPNFSGSGLTGSGSSGAITAQSTYTLTCQSAVGVRTASVTVNLIPAGVEI